MYRFVVSNSLNRKTIMVDGTKTVAELFAEAGIEIGHATPNINGRLIKDTSTVIDTLNLDPNGTYRIAAIEKGDNAANMTVKGNVLTVVSSFTLETLKAIEEYDADCLTMYNEQEEPSFAISLVPGSGNFNNWSVDFGEYTDAEGHAMAQLFVDLPEEDAGKYIMAQYGMALYKLNELETFLTDSKIVEKMQDYKAKLESMITFE